MSTIVIPYKPRPQMLAFHNTNKRWHCEIIHRRFGKTVAFINHLIRSATTDPKILADKRGLKYTESQLREWREVPRLFGYFAPFYSQAKSIAWDLLKYYSGFVPGAEPNESELRVDFPNKGRVRLFGVENPSSFRGFKWWEVGMDEFSQMNPNVFDTVIAPGCIDVQAPVTFMGTILGKNHLWRMWDAHKDDLEWHTLYLKASESGVIPAEILSKERERYEKEGRLDEYLQEFELEPTAAIRGAYYIDLLRVMREKNHITDVPYDSMLPVSVWFDLGMDDSTSIVFVQFFGAQKRCIDYYEMTGMGLEHYVGVMKAKGYVYDTIWLPHDAKVRELGTGKSRFEVLKSLLPGVDVQICPRIAQGTGREVVEGINAVRSTLPNLWIDKAKCARLIDCLENYRHEWDEELGVFRPKPLHDQYSHGADCLRYFSVTASLQMRTQEQNLSPAYSGSILPSRPIFNGDTVRR